MSTSQAGHAARINSRSSAGAPVEQDLPFSGSSSQETPSHDATKDGDLSRVKTLDWDGPDDPANPHNFSKKRKWIITGAALLGTLIIPLNGTSITVAAREINNAFGISDASFPNSYWTVTSWSAGGAVFVMVGLPWMEDLGVRLGYLVFYIFFLLMVIPQAVAQNFATLIVTRFFAGGCVTLLANTLSSLIPDLFASDEERSLPIGLYILCYEVGNTLGPPMFAGVMQHMRNWRWIFYIQLIIYGALLPFFLVTIKETRANVILRKRAKRIRRESGARVYSPGEVDQESLLPRLGKALWRPVYLFSTEPVLFVGTIWSAFSFGTVFLFTQSVEQVFTSVYGFDSYQIGYVQTAVIIGEILGWVISLYGIRLYLQSAKRNDEMPGKPIPEARLYVSVFGSFIGLTGGMFVYAWTSYPSITWVVPAVGLAMVGAGIQIIVTGIADYIVDAYAASSYVASAVSAIAAGENIFAGFLPLATQSMYRKLGNQWASSVLGFIALVLSFAPVVFIWKGRRLRERSPFMLSAGKSFFEKSSS